MGDVELNDKTVDYTTDFNTKYSRNDLTESDRSMFAYFLRLVYRAHAHNIDIFTQFSTENEAAITTKMSDLVK